MTAGEGKYLAIKFIQMSRRGTVWGNTSPQVWRLPELASLKLLLPMVASLAAQPAAPGVYSDQLSRHNYLLMLTRALTQAPCKARVISLNSRLTGFYSSSDTVSFQYVYTCLKKTRPLGTI